MPECAFETTLVFIPFCKRIMTHVNRGIVNQHFWNWDQPVSVPAQVDIEDYNAKA